MARVTWSPAAAADLREIQRYISQDSRQAAMTEARRIRSAVRQLEMFPESGRTVPELASGIYREIVVAPYHIIYRYFSERSRVRVLAVIHGSRTLPPISEAE